MKKYFHITYQFKFPDGHKRRYQLTFDKQNTLLIPQQKEMASDWTRLDFYQCSHCPLTVDDHSRCPITVNMEQLITFFKDEISYSDCVAKVITKQRIFVHKVKVQEGLYSIFGLIMATSGCPHMGFLKPMAYFHLPFASVEETVVRSTSLYLLKQYFRLKDSKKPDWKLENLAQHYQQVHLVNAGILDRIRSLKKKGEADVNALVILDSFAMNLDFKISESLEDYQSIFA
jgi:hypothetical protein